MEDNPDITIKRIWCGPEEPPSGEKSKYSLLLNSIPSNHNVYLKAENISDRIVKDIPAIALDLLEIASYIYCADQSKTRGGKTFSQNGINWYRDFELSIPVRKPEIWQKPEIVGKLSELMDFLADDNYNFKFRKLEGDFPRDAYFDYDEGDPWFKPDSILLFSGGLDSLTGAIEELQDPDRKLLLVSHRPVATINKAQQDLVSKLKEKFNAQNRILHVPVWINKESGITKDASQRSRSFLYASIATVIAMLNNSRTIKFYENGIVSCNLPISDQVVNARASRSTHPKSLKLMSEFFSMIVEDDFQVINPYIDKTKSDVVRLLKGYDAHDLIKHSRSCSHTRTSTILHTHCGVCSQCIERRLAVLYNSLEDDEPEEMYNTRLFLDPLTKSDDKVMVNSYIQHANNLEDLSGDDFFEKFPCVYDIIPNLNKATIEAAHLIYDLHLRHGNQVGTVIRKQIELNSELIRTRKIPPDSLLGMILSESVKKKSEAMLLSKFPTPKGTTWDQIYIEIVSNDSVRIKVGSITKRYHCFDMGFKDKRKADLPNKQWDLLETFAQNDGILNWQSEGSRRGVQKQVETLNKLLKTFFGLSENPIYAYKKKVGWGTKFQIIDSTFYHS